MADHVANKLLALVIMSEHPFAFYSARINQPKSNEEDLSSFQNFVEKTGKQSKKLRPAMTKIKSSK